MASSSPKAQRRWKNFYIFLSLRDLLMLPVSVSFIGIAILISTVTFRNHKDFNVLKYSNYTSQVSACLNIPPPLTKIPWFLTFYQIKRIKTLLFLTFSHILAWSEKSLFTYIFIIWSEHILWSHYMPILVYITGHWEHNSLVNNCILSYFCVCSVY